MVLKDLESQYQWTYQNNHQNNQGQIVTNEVPNEFASCSGIIVSNKQVEEGSSLNSLVEALKDVGSPGNGGFRSQVIEEQKSVTSIAFNHAEYRRY